MLELFDPHFRKALDRFECNFFFAFWNLATENLVKYPLPPGMIPTTII